MRITIAGLPSARLIANTMRQSGDKEMTDIEPLGK
jgi:hypothetical protein